MATTTKLFVLLKNGEFSALAKEFKTRNATINVKNKLGETLLHQAVQNSDIEATKFLIAHGASIDEIDNADNTPLYYAVTDSNYHLVDLLLQSGSNPNIKNCNSRTSLRVAVTDMVADPNIIPLLLSYGADPRIENDAGVSSIEYARRIENEQLIKLLTESITKLDDI